MKPQKRFSDQLQQEKKSRSQINERFTEVGWICDDISPDLGEDFVVHIYVNGIAKGVNFYVQLKSITNLTKRKKGEFLTYYSIPVKDIIHWSEFSFPVVLIIWDIKLREGRWELIKNIQAELDKNQPNWINNKTVRVNIPWVNTTDDIGLNTLKALIGKELYPIIFTQKKFESGFTISIPNNEDDMESRISLENFLKNGSKLALDGKYLKEFTLPDQWKDWFGEPNIKKVWLEFSPKESDKTFPARLFIKDERGKLGYFSGVEFKLVQAGVESLHFSNHHQKSIPLQISLRISHKSNERIDFNCNVLHNNFPVSQINEAYQFLKIFSKNSILTISLKYDDKFDDISVTIQYDNLLDKKVVDFFEDLMFIQKKTNTFLVIPPDGVKREDEVALQKIKKIITIGKSEFMLPEVIFHTSKEILEKINNENKGILEVKLFDTNSHINLFNKMIQTGPIRQTVVADLYIEDIKKLLNQDEEPFIIKLQNCMIRNIYSDWYKS